MGTEVDPNVVKLPRVTVDVEVLSSVNLPRPHVPAQAITGGRFEEFLSPKGRAELLVRIHLSGIDRLFL